MVSSVIGRSIFAVIDPADTGDGTDKTNEDIATESIGRAETVDNTSSGGGNPVIRLKLQGEFIVTLLKRASNPQG